MRAGADEEHAEGYGESAHEGEDEGEDKLFGIVGWARALRAFKRGLKRG